MEQIRSILGKTEVEHVGRPAIQIVYITLGFLFILLTSGVLFGWSSLLLVLQSEGVYSELCETSAPASPSNQTLTPFLNASTPFYGANGTATPFPSEIRCSAQDLRFNIVFLASLLFCFLPAPFYGWLMDTRGARLTNAVSAAAITLGFILFAFGYHTRVLDMLIPSLMLVAAGGSGVLLCILTLGQIRPQYISIVLSLYNVAFDSSPIVFYVYVKLYKAFAIIPKKFFLVYAIVPILCIIFSLFWPKGIGSPKNSGGSSEEDPDKTLELESVETERTTDTNSNNSGTDSEAVKLDDIESSTTSTDIVSSTEQNEGSEVGSKKLFDLPFTVQLFTKESIYLCIFHTTYSFWLSTYMGSIQSRLTAISPGPESVAKIENYSETFGLVLSLAFVAAPLIGYAIYRLKLIKSLFVCISLAIVWSAWKFVPSLDLQLIAFILFAIVRAWYYSIIFNIVTQIFGWTNVGKLWGVYSVVAGVTSLGFYGISWSVVNLWNGSYLFPNIAETIMIIGTMSFAMFLMKRKQEFDRSVPIPSRPETPSLDLTTN